MTTLSPGLDDRSRLARQVVLLSGAGIHRADLRRLARATWDLAQKVTHGNLGRIEAFAAAQATVLVVRTLQALAAEATAPAPPWL
ncbi:MAG TPA: hypothetical protein VGQ26_15690 [Streptosporangiaceae bacterium]|nr:hypothetical protein [Streptosporangiaceae bacterium]